MSPFARILFSLRYRTLGAMVVDPQSDRVILVCHKGKTVRMKRRCSHQGAALETGWIEKDAIVCPWHGCRTPIAKN